MCKMNFYKLGKVLATILLIIAAIILVKEYNKKNLRTQLVQKFLVYKAYDQDGELNFIRHGQEHDGGYVTPIKALEKADILLGYGIADDNSYEDQFSLKYNKPSYGFDCGIEHIKSASPLFTFVSQCIADDKFLYNDYKTNGKIRSFEQQIKALDLEEKKIFIKMDIEGAEYAAFDSILKHSKNITGIVLEVHFRKAEKDAIELLQKLEKDFILVHVHGNNCCVKRGLKTSNNTGVVPTVVELSYINKNLVTKYELSDNQNHPTKLDQRNVQHSPEAVFEILQNK